MKTLVIAEKPDMGRTIAAVLEPKAVNRRTHLEGERYIVTWAIGHLLGLAEPDHYDDKYKKWSIDHLPIIPDRFKLLPNPRTKDQLAVIRDLGQRCDAVVNACDAGREGQLIFAYIRDHLGLRQPVKRLWISDLTPESIRRGFAEMKDGNAYDDLTKAARARSEADWLIGMNGSRAFTTKHNVLLSVGRVQTPVLAIIYDRQREIEAFSSLKYYEVEAFFKQDGTTYRGVWQGERLKEQAKAEAIAAKVKGKPARIAGYEVKDTKEFPPKLYDLTLLQREANGRYGFSAKKTLDLAQALYEKHKAISYPRTSSNYVNEENVPEMHRSLDALKGSPYDGLAQRADKRLVHKGNKYVCNPAKVEDHHAILPTHKRAGALAPDEQKVYDLIVRRFLAHFYPPAEYKVHTVFTEAESETFKTIVKQLLNLGWKETQPESSQGKAKKGGGGKADGENGADGDHKAGGDADAETETDTAFSLDPDRPVHCTDAAAKEKETQPPKPFTEGTLLKAMESAGKQIEDEELRDVMKDAGLGTPATRAATIERLKTVGYVDMKGKTILITPKGRSAVELIRAAGVELLTSPEMTGRWERRLNEIAKGQAADEAFMESVRKFTRLIVEKVRLQQRAAKQRFEGEAATAGKPGRGAGKRGAAGAAARSAVGGGAASAVRSAGAAVRSTAGGGAAGAAVRSARTATAAARTHAEQPGDGTIAACPRPGCGGRIFMGKRGYGCSHYKQGCSFVIWKTSFGKMLTDTMVRTLIEKGRTNKLKLQSESGEEISARIVLKNNATGALEIDPA